MEIEKTIGEIIRENRENKSLLLRQVAALLDIDTAILSKVERNERTATRKQIIKIASILELNEDKLLIKYLSEGILSKIKDEKYGLEALKAAEEKIRFINEKNSIIDEN